MVRGQFRGRGPSAGARRSAGVNIWRGPVGAAALAVLAMGYWGTVAWFAAVRATDMPPLVPMVEGVNVIDPEESGLRLSPSLPPLSEAEPVLTQPVPLDRLWPHFLVDPRPRPLGLAWGTPPLPLSERFAPAR